MNAQQLSDCLGIPLARAQSWIEPINSAMAKFEINTPKRQAAFIAQIGHESALLTHVMENLNYSTDMLLKYFPRHFSPAEAIEYGHRPDAIANRAYANRYGNGNEESGDGYRYRGRGLVQITFRGNYKACGNALGLPLETNPDMLIQPNDAAMSAAWFWKFHRCNELADVDNFKGITIVINGGMNGLEHRQALYATSLNVLKGA